MADQNVTVLVKEIKKALKPEFDAIRSDIKVIKYDLNELKTDHKKFRGEFDEFRNETASRFDSAFKMLETFREEYFAIIAGVKRIEDEYNKKTDHDNTIHSNILSEIKGLKLDYKALGLRITFLEAQMKK